MQGPAAVSPSAVLTGRATRGIFARRWLVALFFLIAGLYAFASMLLGGMLIFARTGVPSTTVWIVTGGNPWWYYPAVFATFPGGSLTLPFFPTVAMIVVSVGVGVGMTVAVAIAVQLVRLRNAAAGRPLAAGTMAGFTPAFLALVTMGACCTTTAASAAGLGVVAQTSGTTVDALLVNNWYLGVFQMAVVLVALLAQEAILVAYGPLLGFTTDATGRDHAGELAPLRRRDVGAVALRMLVIAAALVWADWGFAALFASGGGLTSAAAWFGFVVEHLMVAGLVVTVALFPRSVKDTLSRTPVPRKAWALRGVALFAGILILTWVPPPAASLQLSGLVNQLLGALGIPAAWGAVTPTFTGPITLVLGLVFGFGLLGSFTLLLALRPSWLHGQLVPPLPAQARTTRHTFGELTGTSGDRSTISVTSSSQPEGPIRAAELEGP